MFNSEKKFDSAFDDIFNEPKYWQLFGCPTLNLAAFKRRFTIAYLLGQTFRIPATFLIEHRKLWDFFQSPKLREFVVNHKLLEVVTQYKRPEEFYAKITGSRDNKPLTMSTNLEKSYQIQRDWESDPTKGAKKYKSTFNFVEDTVQKMFEIFPIIINKETTDYRRYLNEALSEYKKAYEISSDLQDFEEKISTFPDRGTTMKYIKEQKKKGKISEETAKKQNIIAIDAKHREMKKMLDLNSRDTFGNAILTLPSGDRTTRPEGHKMPLLDKLFGGNLSIEELQKLDGKEDFMDARNNFLKCRDSNNGKKEFNALNKLIRTAAGILGDISREGEILFFAGLGLGLLSSIPKFVETNLGVRSGMCLLVGGAAILMSSKVGNEIVYNRNLKAILREEIEKTKERSKRSLKGGAR